MITGLQSVRLHCVASFSSSINRHIVRRSSESIHRQMIDNKITIEILYEDDHMIAVNKPANMLSVPGVQSRNVFYEPKVVPVDSEPASSSSASDLFTASAPQKMKFNPNFVPRNEKFARAVRLATEAARSEGAEQEQLVILEQLQAVGASIPRKKQTFMSYLQRRPFNVRCSELLEAIWDRVSRVDFELLSKERDMSRPDYEHCVTDILEENYGRRIFHVHRLDMETSGVLLYAKSDVACARLVEQFREKNLQKVYLARVIGRVDDSITCVDVPIRPDKSNRPFQVVDALEGKPSKTIVKVLKYLQLPQPIQVDTLELVYQKQQNVDIDAAVIQSAAYHAQLMDESSPSVATSTVHSYETDTVTTVQLSPVSGRTHQLRMHMAYLGHPMLGDTLYAPAAVISAHSNRLCLHADAITLHHPISGELMTISSNGVDFDAHVPSYSVVHVSPYENCADFNANAAFDAVVDTTSNIAANVSLPCKRSGCVASSTVVADVGSDNCDKIADRPAKLLKHKPADK